MSMNPFLLLAALLPAIILLVRVYRLDTIEKEPSGLLWKLILFGAISGVVAGGVEWLLLSLLGQFFAETDLAYLIIENFVIIAGTEELCKRFPVKKFAWNNPAFDYRFDAIVYCVFSAIGFAALENVLYVMYDMKALYEAENVADACRLRLEHPEAQIVAGGTDVLVQMREGKRAGKELISIQGLAELKGVRLDENGAIRIGSGTTFSHITRDPLIQQYINVLGEAVDMARADLVPQEEILRMAARVRPDDVCNMLAEGDRGRLSFQGTRYLGFARE